MKKKQPLFAVLLCFTLLSSVCLPAFADDDYSDITYIEDTSDTDAETAVSAAAKLPTPNAVLDLSSMTLSISTSPLPVTKSWILTSRLFLLENPPDLVVSR